MEENLLIFEKQLMCKATNNATFLENSLATPNIDLSSFQQFLRRKSSILTLVQKFDEMCITTNCGISHQAKLANCDTPCIWVGFAEGPPVGTYHMHNPMTKSYSN